MNFSLDDSKSCDSDSLRKFGSRSESPLSSGKRIGNYYKISIFLYLKSLENSFLKIVDSCLLVNSIYN